MWDRSKQNFWVFSHINPCPIVDIKTNKNTGLYLDQVYIWDNKIIERICFAENIDELNKILKELEELKELKNAQ